MSEFFTEDETIARVARLTRTRLVSFVQAEIIRPMRGEAGLMYRRMDLVRMELLCELSDEFEMGDDALGVVISLVDQLHGVRAELRAVMDGIGQESEEVRLRIGTAVRKARKVP